MKCAHVVGSPLARQTGGGAPAASPVTFPAAVSSLWHDPECGVPDGRKHEAPSFRPSLSSRAEAAPR